MATRHQTRNHTREDERLGAYDAPRPMPDEAVLEPTQAPYARTSARDEAMSASGLNVIAGIWLIISPFVLGYGGGDAYWNPIVFGAIVAVVALARLGGAYRATWLAWLNMAIGVWLFISGFWLASTARASWNEWILGVVVFVLGAWSAAASEDARTANAVR
jgi:SPW repeat-containing protein